MKRVSVSKRKIYGAIISLTLLLSILIGCSIVSSNSTPVVDGVIDTSRYVKLDMLLIGPSSTEEIMGYQDIIEKMNGDLKEKINANIEITFIPLDIMNTEYSLLLNSNETFDIQYTSNRIQPNYFTLADQEELKPLDDLLPIYAKGIWADTNPDRWDDIKYEGKIYGIPFGSDEYIANGYIYRKDLLEKYGMELISSLEGIEDYIDTILVEESDMVPIDMDENMAINLYNMFVDKNSAWLPAPGIPLSSLYLVSRSRENLSDIVHPVFSSEFMEFAVTMKDWAEKGYWREDVLLGDNKSDGIKSDITASSFGNLNEYIKKSDEEIEFFCFGEDKDNIIKSSAAKDVLAISDDSKNAERALMMLDLIMQKNDANGLLKYGVRGEISYYSEPNKILESYYDISIKEPYAKFVFDSTSVEEEIEEIININSQYGIPILLGKVGDPRAEVLKYRDRLKKAGIDEVIYLLKEQLKDINFVY